MNKTKGLISVDAEYTGPDDKNNKVISIGIVSMNVDGTNIKATRISLKLSGLAAFDHDSVKAYWAAHGFSAGCFDEFWKHNLKQLETIQTEHGAREGALDILLEADEAAFARAARGAYEEHTSRFNDVTGIVDTCMVDGYCLNTLFLTHGEIPFHYKQGYEYIGYENVDSFLRGVFGMSITDGWEVFAAKQKEFLFPLMANIPFQNGAGHLPEVDACKNAFRYIAGHQLF